MIRTNRLPIVALLFLTTLTACPNSKQAALQATLTGLNTARDGFVAWDDEYQQQIVQEATSLEEGQANLDSYHNKREPLVLGFEVAYKALAVAALDMSSPNVAAALVAAKDLYDAVKQFKEEVTAPKAKTTPTAAPAALPVTPQPATQPATQPAGGSK